MPGKFSRQTMSLPKGPFESDRLIFRALGLQHEPGMWEMLSDPDFVRFVPFKLATGRAAAKALFTDQINGGERFRFHLAIEWKDPPFGEDTMAGFAMCRPTEAGDQMEIGYCIKARFWGQGLASEATRALVNDVAPAMGAVAADLIAKIDIENTGSVRVAEKAGFQKHSQYEEDGRALWIMAMNPDQ